MNKFTITKIFINWFAKFHIISRSSHPEVFLGKGVLKICCKFSEEHPCWSAITIKLFCNFIEITLRHECSPVNLLHIFKTPFLKNTSGWLLLYIMQTLFLPWREPWWELIFLFFIKKYWVANLTIFWLLIVREEHRGACGS